MGMLNLQSGLDYRIKFSKMVQYVLVSEQLRHITLFYCNCTQIQLHKHNITGYYSNRKTSIMLKQIHMLPVASLLQKNRS